MRGLVERMAGKVDTSSPKFRHLMELATASALRGRDFLGIVADTHMAARALGYNDIASVLVAVVIAVYMVTIIIPLIMTQISGASLSGFPTGTSTIFTTLLPVLVLLGSVYLVWKLISDKSGL